MSVASFLTDIFTEMVVNLLPLYLTTVVGVRTTYVGAMESVAF